MFRGKKTYVAAVLLALGAVGGFMAGQFDGHQLLQQLFAAAAIAGLRHGVSKNV